MKHVIVGGLSVLLLSATMAPPLKAVAADMQTGAKQSQSIRDTNVLPGGWVCLNNPNPQCGR